jgi:hypothetical protein
MAEREHRARLHKDTPTPHSLGPDFAIQQVRASTNHPTDFGEQHDHEFRDQ